MREARAVFDQAYGIARQVIELREKHGLTQHFKFRGVTGRVALGPSTVDLVRSELTLALTGLRAGVARRSVKPLIGRDQLVIGPRGRTLGSGHSRRPTASPSPVSAGLLPAKVLRLLPKARGSAWPVGTRIASTL